jgi:hypothetical protein
LLNTGNVKGKIHGPEHEENRRSKGKIVGLLACPAAPVLEARAPGAGFSEALWLTVLPRAGGAVAPHRKQGGLTDTLTTFGKL